MTMTEQYEQDRERLMSELENAADPVRAQTVLGAELDRILFRYNEQCPDERERRAASFMIQTARMALSLADTAGEVKVWERQNESRQKGGPGSLKGLPLVLLAAGIVCAGLVFAMAAGRASGGGLSWIVTEGILLAASAVCFWQSGHLPGRSAARKGTQRTEISVDAHKLYRSLHSVLLTIDRNLDDIRSAAGWEKRSQAKQDLLIDGKTLELCAGLLEAGTSGDGAFALEKLDDVKFFLHEKGIEAVPYSQEHEDWFDLLPGAGTGTVRPALAAEGVLLKKGLAVGGR